MSEWLSHISPTVLNETVYFIKAATSESDPVASCEAYCKALNKLWSGFYTHREECGELTDTEKNKGRSDAQEFRELLISGMSPNQQVEWIQCESFRHLSHFEPPVMNHDTLRKENYDPSAIPVKLRGRASEEHRQLLNAYKRVAADPHDEGLRIRLLKKAAQLLYVVRSNIAHSEKTPKGPDLEKAKRDRSVGRVTAAAIRDLFEILFQHPNHRLAVYGTLAPGKPNSNMLDGINGSWSKGQVQGELWGRDDGVPLYRWQVPGSPVPVDIFESQELGDHFERLDRFEGRDYRRTLIPVDTEGRQVICSVYQAAKEDEHEA